MPAPLIFTDSAADKVKQLVDEEGNPDLKLRVFVQGGGCSGFQYGFTFDEIVNDDDTQMNKNGVTLLIDAMSLQYLAGAEIDYKEDLQGAQFVIKNPNATTHLRLRVELLGLSRLAAPNERPPAGGLVVSLRMAQDHGASSSGAERPAGPRAPVTAARLPGWRLHEAAAPARRTRRPRPVRRQAVLASSAPPRMPGSSAREALIRCALQRAAAAHQQLACRRRMALRGRVAQRWAVSSAQGGLHVCRRAAPRRAPARSSQSALNRSRPGALRRRQREVGLRQQRPAAAYGSTRPLGRPGAAGVVGLAEVALAPEVHQRVARSAVEARIAPPIAGSRLRLPMPPMFSTADVSPGCANTRGGRPAPAARPGRRRRGRGCGSRPPRRCRVSSASSAGLLICSV